MSKKIIGNVNLTDLYLNRLPDILKDITVDGNFYCHYNKLTSLENSPSSVGRHFWCNSNKLTSLEGAPTNVGGNFYCSNNSVQFTEAQVRAICNVKGNVYV